jgi:hypothetical protein
MMTTMAALLGAVPIALGFGHALPHACGVHLHGAAAGLVEKPHCCGSGARTRKISVVH